MAELDTSSGNNGKRASPRRRKKRSTRVDMTAMVDVAFLLLTFFVLTATISGDNLIETVMPPPCEEDDCNPKINAEKILTLVLDTDDKLFYYHGTPDTAQLKETTYAANGLRKVLFAHLHRYRNRCDEQEKQSNCWDPIFVVKPCKNSRYVNLVNTIDELSVVQAPKYVIADLILADSLLLNPIASVD